MGGGGLWNLQFLISLPYRCYKLNLVKLAQFSVVLEKNMLHVTDVVRHPNQRMTSYDGCQPIAIRHLSDSGDLKITKFFNKYNLTSSKIMMLTQSAGTFKEFALIYYISYMYMYHILYHQLTFLIVCMIYSVEKIQFQ